MFQAASLAIRAGELRRPTGVNLGVKPEGAPEGGERGLRWARCGRLPGQRGRVAASRGASGGIKGAKRGQPARLELWDKGRETED